MASNMSCPFVSKLTEFLGILMFFMGVGGITDRSGQKDRYCGRN